MLTREIVRNQLLAYLNHRITLVQLVDWAENVMNNETFEPRDATLLGDVVARIGVADVENFGLAWDDCYDLLSRMGYQVQVVAA
jgi:hypothetical protein